MSVKQDLKNFYNNQSSKYAQTRKKERKDGEIIVNYIKSSGKQKIKILELGCGSGRFYNYLKKNLENEIEYIGVDISDGLLNYANSKNKNQKLICQDMTDFLLNQKNELFDFVICIASFHHISNKEERLLIMRNIYKVLKYKGKLIMLNRALSKRFKKKYQKQYIISRIKYFLSFGYYDYKDILVPWIAKEKVFYRYYHFFSLNELKNLGEQASFVIKKLVYIDKNGNYVNNPENANNSFSIFQKWICDET